ncbi:MAG: DUF3857 domain-containing protein [Candidatus Hydrogenedentes bacterium]|nr:DUF3857 domain-containing protein [Candidatus Hydrogenedentota bacterium]
MKKEVDRRHRGAGARFLFACALTILLAPSGRADTLYLRDGEQAAGRLIKMNGRKLWFEGTDGVATFRKSEVLKVQLQRAREFDDIATADQITDPELKACIEQQPVEADYPAAGYVTLLERCIFDLTEPGVVTERRRMIVKVMRQRGENVAEQSVWYFEDTDTPAIDFALTVTPDGRVLHLDDAALKNESLFARLPDYRRLSRFRFACKEPRPGSILDVQYTVVRKRGGVLDPFYAEESFREREPIVRKEVVALVHESREDWLLSQRMGPDVEDAARAVEGNVVRLTWSLREPQRGIVPEPLMPPAPYFVPALALGERATWQELAAAYGARLAELEPVPAELVEKAKAVAAEAGPDGAEEAVYNFVTRGIRTVGVPQRYFRYVPYPPGQSAARGMANELDKNFLYFRLLKAVGVDCEFALVRGRNEGPLADSVPSLRAFNRSAVRLPSGRFSTTNSDTLPFAPADGPLQGAKALVIGPGSAGPVATPVAAPEEELDSTRFEAALAADGTLTLEVTYRGEGSAGEWMRNLKDLDKQQLTNRLFQLAGYLHPGAVLADYETTDLADLAITPAITLHCQIPAYATTAGEELMLFTLPSLFYDASDVGRPEREHALFWDRVARESATGTIALPEGFEVYSVPEDVAFDSPTVAYRAAIEQREGIQFEDVYDLKVNEAPREAYADYKACRELRARLPLQRIILRRVPSSN